MSIDRVTSFFEALGLLLLTTAIGIIVAQRWGIPAGLFAAAILCFVWSALLTVGRRREAVPTVEPEQVFR